MTNITYFGIHESTDKNVKRVVTTSHEKCFGAQLEKAFSFRPLLQLFVVSVHP